MPRDAMLCASPLSFNAIRPPDFPARVQRDHVQFYNMSAQCEEEDMLMRVANAFKRYAALASRCSRHYHY